MNTNTLFHKYTLGTFIYGLYTFVCVYNGPVIFLESVMHTVCSICFTVFTFISKRAF